MPNPLLPNLRLNPPRANVPAPGEWRITAEKQESEGKVYHLHGNAEVEGNTMLFRADDMDYNEETGDLHASGNVYFHSFQKNEQVWADRVEYNTDSEAGKFYKVHGQTYPHIDARPGILTTNNPFYFEGEWAERREEKYIVHNGFMTNCKIPRPWWTLNGPKFDIIPGERAIAYRAVFHIRGLPLFFAPFFYKSLEKEPRKSGFLIPNVGNSSQRGEMVGLGYFWAINRSFDLTYRTQYFTTRGITNHFDFRGKPRPGTDYDAIIYGVEDRGIEQGGVLQKYGGVSVSIAGKSDLGDGWTARGAVNYITSFRFRQNWSESFNEAIGSEVQSVGFLNKNWSNYTLNIIGARLENFQSSEIQTINPITLATSYETNAVTIRKLPEVDLDGREKQIWEKVPLWFSFDSSAGLLYREEPLFTSTGTLVERFQTSQGMNRLDFAPHVMTTLHWGAFSLVPRFGFEETFYGEGQALDPAASLALGSPAYQVVSTSLLRSSRDFSLDVIFPPLERVFNKKTIFGDKLKHVIEPRATYQYVTGVGDDFTRFLRFDETDLVTNTNEVELSLANRIFAKRGDSVLEIFSWEVWQKRFFDPTFGGALVDGQRNVILSSAELTPYAFLAGPLSSSPVVSVMRISPINGFSIDWRADYSHTLNRFVDSTLSVDWRWKKYFVSVGDNLVHTDPVLTAPANQFRFHAGFGDANHRGWSAGIDGVYDYHQRQLEYTTTQVTYNTDCCGLSVQYRRFAFGTRNENQFRVAFAVSNIGTFGTLRKQDRIF